MSSVITRIDKDLYKEIMKVKKDMELDRGRPVTFALASRYWFKEIKDNNELLIKF